MSAPAPLAVLMAGGSATPCRCCGTRLRHVAADFGAQPLANALVPMDAPATPDARWPLRVMVCADCLLVQLEQAPDPALLFGEYAYLSSVSAGWLAHAARFAAMARTRFALDARSLVVEVGSNDGYLLRHLLAAGVPCLGIEAADNIARAACAAGVPTESAFFSRAQAQALADAGRRADLLVANNVLAHVPDLTDFVQGLAIALAPRGVLSIEVPHVLAMLRGGQFDTVYHEHVCYFSAMAVQRVLAAAGLAIFDVAALPTHGGSLRILAQHRATGVQPATGALADVIAGERAEGLDRPGRYTALADAGARTVAALRGFLARARGDGARVAGYAAAAKGAMLLNAAGLGAGDLLFVADANRLKQGRRLPGCRIPVLAPAALDAARPDYLLVLAWNIADEIIAATAGIARWGGRHVIPLPALRVVAA